MEKSSDGTGTPTFWEAGILFRHSGWAADRLLVVDALRAVPVPESRTDAFTHCGANAWVLQDKNNPQVHRISCDFCHDRFCRPCANARASVAARNLKQYLKDEPHRFLTLTIKSNEEPLATLLDRLAKSFQKLRRTSLWRHAVRGGAAFLEITWNAERRSWHPHLHCVIEGSYLRQNELADLWNLITGDSCIVHIRLIRNADATIGYVTKYAAKPMSTTFLRDAARLLEAVRAMAGRKMITTFGSWRGFKLTEKQETGEWTPVMPLAALISAAGNGDENSLRILRSLRKDPKWHSPTQFQDPPDTPIHSSPLSPSETASRGAHSVATHSTATHGPQLATSPAVQNAPSFPIPNGCGASSSPITRNTRGISTMRTEYDSFARGTYPEPLGRCLKLPRIETDGVARPASVRRLGALFGLVAPAPPTRMVLGIGSGSAYAAGVFRVPATLPPPAGCAAGRAAPAAGLAAVGLRPAFARPARPAAPRRNTNCVKGRGLRASPACHAGVNYVVAMDACGVAGVVLAGRSGTPCRTRR